MKMKNNFKASELVMPVALIIIGLLFAIFPDRSATIVCYCVGAVLCALGIFSMIDYVNKSRHAAGSQGLVTAVLYLVTALVLFIKPALVSEIITVVFGIALIVNGALKVQLFVELNRYSAKNRWFTLVVAVVSFVLGALMVFDPFSTRAALMIFAGISLIVGGALDIMSVLFVPEKREVDESKVIDIED